MKYQRVVVGPISRNVAVDRHPVMTKPPGPVETRYIALFKVQEGRIEQGGRIGDVDCRGESRRRHRNQPEFKQGHPDVELRVLTTDTDTGVGRDGADLWIPLGPVDDPALDSVPFCAERLIPVAAPKLAAAIDIADPAALLDSPLLHLEERYVPRFDWPRWFRHHGVAVDGDVPGDRSNDYSLVLHAALAGAGVALGWEHIVRELLGQGRLVAVGPVVETGIHFPLLSRHGRPLSPAAETLRTWILANAPG